MRPATFEVSLADMAERSLMATIPTPIKAAARPMLKAVISPRP